MRFRHRGLNYFRLFFDRDLDPFHLALALVSLVLVAAGKRVAGK